MAPGRVWIVGAGRFGTLAARRLGARMGRERLMVVDPDPEAVRRLAAEGYPTREGDGADFLMRHLGAGHAPEWIVPALPRHLAYEWLCRRLGARLRPAPPVPQAVLEGVPVVIHGEAGAVYLSIARHLCPDDCPEPEEVCTMTGEPRPLELYDHLARLDLGGWNQVVIRSRQLAPGVGGYPPEDLWKALERLSEGGPGLVATACRCHGVVHALSVEPEAAFDAPPPA